MELEKGVQRWVVDISKWNPSPNHFSFVMSFLPQHEHSSITSYSASQLRLLHVEGVKGYPNSLEGMTLVLFVRFVKMEDRKRALVSRLLQYSLVHQVLGIPFDEIIIRRTVEGKPYLECDDRTWEFPNFNFNTSHDGDYVAIASEPVCLVGIDIANHSTPLKESVDEFIQYFSTYFSNLEWSDIVKADSSSEKLNVFYRYWCLKESYAKAIGTGVGNRMDNVEFHHSSWKDLYIVVDGKELKDWRFWLLELGNDHLVSIARGHPTFATTNYRRTLKRTDFGEREYNLALNYPNAALMFRQVEDLLPFPNVPGGIYMDVTERKMSTDEEIVEGEYLNSCRREEDA